MDHLNQILPPRHHIEDSLKGGCKGIVSFALCALGVLGGSTLFACLGPPTATPTRTSGTGADQLARGAPFYAQNCATASCHGIHGEGIREGGSFRAFPLVGKEFAARNPSAQIIFDVVRSGGEENLRALTDQQIYDAIAYELSQNDIHWPAPIDERNAAMVSSGAQNFILNTIYPPLTNAALQYRHVWTMTAPASDPSIGLQLDQFAEASKVGDTMAPDGGALVIVVFTLRDLRDKPIQVDPQFLQLDDFKGRQLDVQALDPGSPIERFHPQVIQPDHNTSAIAVFSVPAGVTTMRLVYDDHRAPSSP